MAVLSAEDAAYIEKMDHGNGPALVETDIPDPVTGGKYKLSPQVASAFSAANEDFKAVFGHDIPLVSAYRDPARNQAADGAPHSKHLHGAAIDIDRAAVAKAKPFLEAHGLHPLGGTFHGRSEDNHFELKAASQSTSHPQSVSFNAPVMASAQQADTVAPLPGINIKSGQQFIPIPSQITQPAKPSSVAVQSNKFNVGLMKDAQAGPNPLPANPIDMQVIQQNANKLAQSGAPIGVPVPDVAQGVDIGQGFKNLGNAALHYVGDVAHQVSQIPQALGAEYNQFTHDPNAGLNAYGATGTGVAQGVRDMIQLPLSLPSILQNAWLGRQVSSPLLELPSVKDIPGVGPALDKNMQEHPVFSTTGNLVGQSLPIVEGAAHLFGEKAPKVDVAEGVPEITHNGVEIRSEEDLKRALHQEYIRNKLLNSVDAIDKGAQPIGHGDMLKDLDAQLQSKLAKVPDSLGPKSETALPDIVPTHKSAAESASVLDEHAQNIEAAHSLAEDATQARKAAEQELAQATGIHDDPVAAQRALGQRVLESEQVRKFQRTPEMEADKELLNRVLETRQQELEAHALLDTEQAPTRRADLPSPEPIDSRMPSRPTDMMDFLTAPGEHAKALPQSDMLHSVGMSVEKATHTPYSLSSIDANHQTPESMAAHPSMVTTDSGAEVFHQGAPHEQVQTEANKLQASIQPKGGTLISIAEAQNFVRKFMPNQMRHLMNVLEGGKNNQTVVIDHEPLNKGGTVKNSREVHPFAIEKRTIGGAREVQNLIHQYSPKGDAVEADLTAVRNNLVQRLQKYGVGVDAKEQMIKPGDTKGIRAANRAVLNKLANKLPEIERTHVYIHDHNFGETTRGEGVTAGSHRLDRITESSLTGKEQAIPEGEHYQNEIAPAYKALNEVMNHPEATPELKRVVKQMTTGGVTRNSLKELRSNLQSISKSVLQKLCGL